QHDAPLRDARVPDRAQRRQPGPGRGDLAVPLPAAGSRGVPPAALHPKGVGVAGARDREVTIRSATFTYANLVPFLAFALFPFYFMLITSLKSNAELYNLNSMPFLVHTLVIAVDYQYVFERPDALSWMKNNLIIS